MCIKDWKDTVENISQTKFNQIAKTNHSEELNLFEMKVFVSFLFVVLLSISQLNAGDVRRDDKVRIRF